MNISYFLFWIWNQLVDHVLPLTGYLLLAILVPRLGRMAVRVIESRLDEGEEATKARLALAGALVYLFQAVAYFVLIIAALSNLGVPALGAAIPATVVSAAVGFGAQKIIGDFLAGFFILSEKQFGVGDYVSFDGVTGVEGTVVALTLRTTKVRTPTGEVVMVPNGSAGVVTNFSQDWSRAVVDLAVPVQSGETLEEIKDRVDEVSARAVADSAIAADVAGDLEILPATGLIAPTVAGQPWQVNFRILVTVNPARQWAVERGIRSALIAAFWDHYNVAGMPGLNAAGLGAAGIGALGQGLPAGAGGVTAGAASAAEAGAGNSDDAAATAEEPVVLGASAGAAEGPGEKDHGPGRPAEPDPDLADEEPARRGIWRDDHPEGWWRRLWTVGGRVRRSTVALFVGLALVALLMLFSANPEDTSAGWLSPARWSTTAAPAPERTEGDARPQEAVDGGAAEASEETSGVETSEDLKSPESTGAKATEPVDPAPSPVQRGESSRSGRTERDARDEQSDGTEETVESKETGTTAAPSDEVTPVEPETPSAGADAAE